MGKGGRGAMLCVIDRNPDWERGVTDVPLEGNDGDDAPEAGLKGGLGGPTVEKFNRHVVSKVKLSCFEWVQIVVKRTEIVVVVEFNGCDGGCVELGLKLKYDLGG